MCLVGVPEHAHPRPSVMVLIFKRRSIAGSLIGGIAETQEMLDFCAEKGIVSDIEMIPAQAIDEAYERMQERRQISLRDRQRLARLAPVGLPPPLPGQIPSIFGTSRPERSER